MNDGCSQPTRAGMLRAPRPLLWCYWLFSGESGFVLILMTAEETAEHLCGPPDTWSRRDAPSAAAVRTGKGRARGTHESPSTLWSTCVWTSAPFGRPPPPLSCRSRWWRGGSNWFLTSCVRRRRRRRPHIVDGLYVAHWAFLIPGAAHLMEIQKTHSAWRAVMVKAGKFALKCAPVSRNHRTGCVFEMHFPS